MLFQLVLFVELGQGGSKSLRTLLLDSYSIALSLIATFAEHNTDLLNMQKIPKTLKNSVKFHLLSAIRETLHPFLFLWQFCEVGVGASDH